MGLHRRHFLQRGLAAGVIAQPSASWANLWLSDSHSHFGFSMRTRDLSLAEELKKNKVSLVSWSVVADAPFIARDAQGRVAPTRAVAAGEFQAFFQRQLQFTRRRLAREGLPVLLDATGIERALAGECQVVLSTEGAHFLEGDLQNLQLVYDAGFRQIGLGHFVEGDLTDIRTEMPKHGGLTALGKQVIEKCNALGILVDMAHSTDKAVEDALAVSSAPLLWSHSTIIARMSDYRSRGGEVMGIYKGTAQKMAKQGGVIGIWPSLVNYRTIEDYGDGIRQLMDWVGDDHLTFGTDMDGLGPFAMFKNNYADLVKTAEYMLRKGVSENSLNKIAIGNYARVLRTVFQARQKPASHVTPGN